MENEKEEKENGRGIARGYFLEVIDQQGLRFLWYDHFEIIYRISTILHHRHHRLVSDQPIGISNGDLEYLLDLCEYHSLLLFRSFLLVAISNIKKL